MNYAKLLALCLAMIDDESDQKKFEELFLKYRNIMHDCAYKILNDPHLAQDAVSVAMFGIARNIKKIDDVYSSDTKYYCTESAKNAAKSIAKKQNKIIDYAVWIDDENTAEIADDVDDIEAYIVSDAINRLSKESYRQVIILKYTMKYTNIEIASMLGYTKAKVDKMLSRARKELESMLKDVE